MRKFKTVALEINYCDRADTDHGIRSVCGQLLCNQVKEVRTLQEIPRLMDDYEFRKELERIQEHLNAISKGSNTVEVRRNYLISCVTVPSAKIYTPDQLRQIFDLTWKQEEHPYKPASFGRSEN